MFWANFVQASPKFLLDLSNIHLKSTETFQFNFYLCFQVTFFVVSIKMDEFSIFATPSHHTAIFQDTNSKDRSIMHLFLELVKDWVVKSSKILLAFADIPHRFIVPIVQILSNYGGYIRSVIKGKASASALPKFWDYSHFINILLGKQQSFYKFFSW